MEVQAPEVVLIADGGGVGAAFAAPLHGAEAVAPVFTGENRAVATLALWTTDRVANGATAARADSDGEPAAVRRRHRTGCVTRPLVRDPRGLTRLDEPPGAARRTARPP